MKKHVILAVLCAIFVSGCATLENMEKPDFNKSNLNMSDDYFFDLEKIDLALADNEFIMGIDSWIRENLW